MTLAERAGAAGRERELAFAALAVRLREERIAELRIAWADLHGTLRGKTLVLASGAGAIEKTLRAAFDDGIGLVGTVLLKDTSDRTAVKVFEPGAPNPVPALAGASNLLLLPDAASFKLLPWAGDAEARVGWLRAEPYFADGSAVPVDPRRVLERALAQLAARGLGFVCGLEVEFHIYRITDERGAPEAAAWPAEPPAVALLHPGYDLLAENWADRAHAALGVVRRTALALGLPLASLEVELGPSQFEAVFNATDAMAAADQMILLRNHVRQALGRAGFHASFVCKPPFPDAIASGWHLHQSVVDAASGRNLFMRENGDASEVLSELGRHWLAGLLAHARGMAAVAAPTISAYSRFAGSVMAPQAALWGRDNRGAMLRVLGGPGDTATRIENRAGEPMANPYLVMAAQIAAGLHGIDARLAPGPATESPYAEAEASRRLPATLGEALDCFAADTVLQQAFGEPMARLYDTIKRQEIARHAAAADKDEWLRREYFGRY